MKRFKSLDFYMPINSEISRTPAIQQISIVKELKAELDCLKQDAKIKDFSQRLQDLLMDKSTLKIDYQEISKDLKANGFQIDGETDACQYNEGLDTIRLKYGLELMHLTLKELYEDNVVKTTIPKESFHTEVVKIFDILKRDFQRLNSYFSHQLKSNDAFNLDNLEDRMKRHIHYYNTFTDILHDYFQNFKYHQQ